MNRALCVGGNVAIDSFSLDAGVIAVGVGGNLLAPAASGDFDKVTEVARQYAEKFAEIKGI